MISSARQQSPSQAEQKAIFLHHAEEFTQSKVVRSPSADCGKSVVGFSGNRSCELPAKNRILRQLPVRCEIAGRSDSRTVV